MWKKLLKLKDVAATFFTIDLKDGVSTYFWTDIWCDFQPLLHVSGEVGTQMLGIGQTAKVVNAKDAQGWKLRKCCGRVMQQIIEKTKCIPPPSPEAGRDRPL